MKRPKLGVPSETPEDRAVIVFLMLYGVFVVVGVVYFAAFQTDIKRTSVVIGAGLAVWGSLETVRDGGAVWVLARLSLLLLNGLTKKQRRLESTAQQSTEATRPAAEAAVRAWELERVRILLRSQRQRDIAVPLAAVFAVLGLLLVIVGLLVFRLEHESRAALVALVGVSVTSFSSLLGWMAHAGNHVEQTLSEATDLVPEARALVDYNEPTIRAIALLVGGLVVLVLMLIDP